MAASQPFWIIFIKELMNTYAGMMKITCVKCDATQRSGLVDICCDGRTDARTDGRTDGRTVRIP